MRLWIVLNVWDGKITKFSKNKTVKCYHFVRFCNRARIRLCVLTWLCIICFICCCCTLNCCFCCLAWRCSCCLWSSSSSFLRSVSLGVFSAKILETIRTSSSFSSSSLYSLLLCGSFFPRMRGFTTFSSLRPCGHGFISACKCIFLFWSSFLQPTLCRDGSKEYNSRRSRVFFASVQRNGPLKKEDIV